MILQKGGGFVLNVRCRKILADLLNAPYPIPTEILMEKYDVSERSIKYDIGKLRACAGCHARISGTARILL